MVRIMSLACLVFSAAVSAVAGASSHTQLRAHSFVQTLDFKHVLRVCNAYPYNAAVDVFMGKEKLNKVQLAYMDCGEFSPKLQTGAKIDFKVGESNVGTFTISDLPQADAVLLMVLFRHDIESTAVSFESHTFAQSSQAQVAVIDTYRGKAVSELRVEDHKDHKEGHLRSELLRYSNVVAVTPGIYDLKLEASSGSAVATDQLVAKEREAYVVMRCGAEVNEPGSYPETLLVYPRSDPSEFEKSAASPQEVFAAMFLILLVALHR